jgi:pimeloyl-ACP methyl ester carboxylesterase
MKRLAWIIVIILGSLSVIYVLGPKPEPPVYDPRLPELPSDPGALEARIAGTEALRKVKPDNQARIVWFDTLHRKTPYAVVYLHGFSASQEEGDPVHEQFARTFGCNLYLARLAEHGIDTSDALVGLTADKYWNSVKEALAVGMQIGEKVILMGTSTGGTNALQLAATYPDKVHALILYSPNIEIFDPSAPLLNDPWGLQIARQVIGSKYILTKNQTENYRKYWSSKYRLEAVVNLQEMVETTMTAENFVRVKQPTLLLYYYKDEVHQDSVVKVSAMREMFETLGTPEALKRATSIPTAGNHVIASWVISGDIPRVQSETDRFAMEVLKMQPVQVQ